MLGGMNGTTELVTSTEHVHIGHQWIPVNNTQHFCIFSITLDREYREFNHCGTEIK